MWNGTHSERTWDSARAQGEIKEIEGITENSRTQERFRGVSVVDLSVFLLAFFTTRSGKSRTGGGFLYN